MIEVEVSPDVDVDKGDAVQVTFTGIVEGTKNLGSRLFVVVDPGSHVKLEVME